MPERHSRDFEGFDEAIDDLAQISERTRGMATGRLRADRMVGAALVVALAAFASSLGCASWGEEVCADFPSHSQPARFSIGTSDALEVDGLVDRLEPGQVVAVGEGTHGTHEFRRFQVLVMQALVEELGYRGVALEGFGVEALWVNDYICNDEEPFDPILAASDEYYDAIDWLRAYNQARDFEDCVEFIPFDSIDNGRAPIVQVLTTLDELGVTLGVEPVHEACLRDWFEPDAKVADGCRLQAAEALGRALAKLEPEHAELRAAASFARQGAQQAEAMARAEVRDYYMAANVMAALEDHPQGIVVWAHDGHVSEGPIPAEINGGNSANTMGSVLSRWLGERYVSIGQLSTGGRAMVDLRAAGRRREVSLPTRPGSFEALVGTADIAVDLRDLSPDNLAWQCVMVEHHVMWLGGPSAPSRTRGGQRIVPGANFDILVVLGETSSARQTPGRYLGHVP